MNDGAAGNDVQPGAQEAADFQSGLPTQSAGEELLARFDTTPPDSSNASQYLDQAIALARETNDDDLEYRARVRLIATTTRGKSDTELMLSTFGWCLGKHDSDPARFPLLVDGGFDLLWYFKWMSGALSSSPLFPRDEITAVINEMEERYTVAGVGISGVLQARFDEAVDNGRWDDAEQWRVKLNATPRDNYSHCDACGRREEAIFFATMGKDEEAAAKFDEIVEYGLTCGKEPEFSMAAALESYLKLGQLDKAKATHLRSYRMAKNKEDLLGVIAKHLVFCAITGNEERGLALLERHISWLGNDGLNSRQHFSALASFGVVLTAIDEKGFGDTIVRGSDAPELVAFFGEHEGGWSVRDLAAASWAAAEKLAAAFDERNGNSAYSNELAEYRNKLSTHYPIELEDTSFVAIKPNAVEPDPTDAAGWLVRATERLESADLRAAASAAEAGLAACTAEGLENDRSSERGRLRAELYVVILHALTDSGRHDEAEERLRQRLGVLEEMGWSDQARIERQLGVADFALPPTPITASDYELILDQLGESNGDAETRADYMSSLAMLKSIEGDDDQATALLVQALAVLEEHPNSALIVPTQLQLVGVYAQTGLLNEAKAILDQLPATQAEASESLHTRARNVFARILEERVNISIPFGDFDRARTLSEERLELMIALGDREGIANAANHSSQLANISGDQQRAISRMRLAVREAELGELDSVVSYKFALGRMLLDAGDPEASLDQLSDVLAAEERMGLSGEVLADTEYWLGMAHRQLGEDPQAYGMWSQAVAHFEEAGAAAASINARIALGRMLLDYNDEESIEILERAATLAKDDPTNIQALVNAVHALGRAKCAFGNEDGLADLDWVIDTAETNGVDWLVADVTESKAIALSQLRRTEESITTALQAADAYVAAGIPENAGTVELLAARQLVELGKPADAVAIYRESLERLGAVPNAVTVVSLELGDVLESLGRHAEAAEARALAE